MDNWRRWDVILRFIGITKDVSMRHGGPQEFSGCNGGFIILCIVVGLDTLLELGNTGAP